MELIKKIKQAEKQAQETVEQAKSQAVRKVEENHTSQTQTSANAEQERKKAVKAAVSAAQSQGLAEVDTLKSQAEKNRQQLRDKVTGKMASAVARIVDHLKG